MVNHQQLQKETSAFLNKKVLAVGIFDVSLTMGKRTIAPAAAGVVTYMGTRYVEKKMGKDKNTGAKVAAAAIGLAGAVGTSKLIHHGDAKKSGLTPIMIVAITGAKIYLLDWKGTHSIGKGPTKILMEFSRRQAKIKKHTRALVYHTVEISEDGQSAKIECSLAATQRNEKMNREVLSLLNSQ